MLTSVLFELEPLHQGDVIGDHLHGWLMTEIARFDADLAHRLHAPARGKPFSVWLGPRFALGPDGPTRDDTDPLYWLRVTSLDPALTGLLPGIATSNHTMRFGSTQFRNHGVINGEHAWTGTSSTTELWNRWITGPPPRGRVRLRFLAPTTFGKGKSATTLLPVGSLVVRSLLKTWQENASPSIDDAVAADLIESIQEEAHVLHTVAPLQFDSHRLKGFVGWCEYSCGHRATDATRRLLHLLADFAFYSGVGLKRTMGMGQVVGESC